jgi:hypothetical protein
MNLYKWTIEKIEGIPNLNGLENVIGNVSWELEIRDTDDHSVHYIRRSTTLDTSNLNSETFTDFLELSNEQVLQWVWNIVGKENIEQEITKELNDLRNPPDSKISQMAMPWKNACCPQGTGMPEGQPGGGV